MWRQRSTVVNRFPDRMHLLCNPFLVEKPGLSVVAQSNHSVEYFPNLAWYGSGILVIRVRRPRETRVGNV